MLARGSTIDKYRVIEPIAAGGMGVVYKAEHVHLRRLVAIKVLLSNLALDERTRTRFAQEAYVQSQLDHPHIVEVTDFIFQGEILAFVMRYQAGPSLEHVIQSEVPGRWPLARVAEVMRPVVEGVAYAHARGVVHRDLKPANVLLDRSTQTEGLGVPGITDFGLAKVLATTGGLTRTGAMLGTVPYMAPEQFRGSPNIDARADVFALAMMFRRLLTGSLPVDPNNMEAVAELYSGRRPMQDLAQMGLGLPPDLLGVLRAALSLDPAQRPDKASCFLPALAAFSRPQGVDLDAVRQDYVRKLSSAYANTGEELVQQGRFREAERWFFSAAMLDPAEPNHMRDLQLAVDKQEALDKAREQKIEGERQDAANLAVATLPTRSGIPTPFFIVAAGALLVALIGWVMASNGQSRLRTELAQAQYTLSQTNDKLTKSESDLKTTSATLSDTKACLQADAADQVGGTRSAAIAAWKSYLEANPKGSCAAEAAKRIPLLYRYTSSMKGTSNTSSFTLEEPEVCRDSEVPTGKFDCTTAHSTFTAPLTNAVATFGTSTSGTRTAVSDRLQSGYRLTSPTGEVLHAYSKSELTRSSGDWQSVGWRKFLPINASSPLGEYQLDIVVVDDKLNEQRVATTFFTLTAADSGKPKPKSYEVKTVPAKKPSPKKK